MSTSAVPFSFPRADASAILRLWQEAMRYQSSSVHRFNWYFVWYNLEEIEGICERNFGADLARPDCPFEGLVSEMLIYFDHGCGDGDAADAACCRVFRDPDRFADEAEFLVAPGPHGRIGGPSLQSMKAEIRDELVTALGIFMSYFNEGTTGSSACRGTFWDRETGLDDAALLLTRNWRLAQRFMAEEAAPGQARKRYPDIVLQSLLENKRANGGCRPGFAGRLVRDTLEILWQKATASP